MDQLVIEFVRNHAGLVPVVKSGLTGPQPKRVDVENADDFVGVIVEGAAFAAELIEQTGRGANRVIVVRMQRSLASEAPQQLQDFWIAEGMLRRLRLDLKLGHHVLLRGPKGTGKTTLAQLLAINAGVPFLKVDCTGIYKPKDLVGVDTSRSGTLYFVPNEMVRFLEAAQGREGRPNAIVCLDELSRIRGNGEGLHPLLDDTRSLSVTTSEGTRVINVPEGVVFIATANPVGGGHTGTAGIDIALLDRFEPYDLDYPAEEFEVDLLKRRTRILETEAIAIVGAAKALRDKAKAGLLPTGGGPSPRRTLRAAAFVAGGISLADALEAKLLAHYPGDPSLDSTERGIALATLRATGVLQTPSRSSGRVTLKDNR